MRSPTALERLSGLSTQWSVIYQAHWASSDARAAAQCAFLQRYCGAVYRYLLGALRDEEAAEELFQEFALRFVRGDFRCAQREQGRFRYYLKTTLIRLVTDYYRRQAVAPCQLRADVPQRPVVRPAGFDDDEGFAASWRDELLAQVWQALASSHPYYDRVLRWHVEHPDATSSEVAVGLSREQGQPVSATAVRVALHRARKAFARLLVEEVRRSLEDDSAADVTRELEELGLLPYCAAVLPSQPQPAPPA